MIKPDFIITEPAPEYHLKRDKFLSSHALGDFRRCPALFHGKTSGEIADEDRPAYIIGRAAHTLILEGIDAFNAEYVVGEPVNPNTGKAYGKTTQAYQAWFETQDKPVVAPSDFEFIKRLQAAVWTHIEAGNLLQDGIAEGVVRTEYCGVPCQIRMDFFSDPYGIIDLKTCDNLDYFESDARRFQYIHQAAFYRAILRKVTGRNYPFRFIAVEKHEPLRCGVWQVADETLELAEIENAAAIGRLKQCRAENCWPTGYEEPRIITNF